MGKSNAPAPEPDEFGDIGFQRRLAALDRARRRARDILGVDEGADDEAIHAAYRREAKLCHPDRAQGDEAAHHQFLLVRAAHELLVDGKLSPILIAQESPSDTEPTEPKEDYNVDSEWGHFLWWRDKFFDL